MSSAVNKPVKPLYGVLDAVADEVDFYGDEDEEEFFDGVDFKFDGDEYVAVDGPGDKDGEPGGDGHGEGGHEHGGGGKSAKHLCVFLS